MPFQVTVAGTGLRFACRDDQPVLSSVSDGGSRCVPAGCRGGGCGICRVEVLEGDFECGRMSDAQISAEDQAQGVVLACQLYPRSDLRVRALGRKDCGKSDPTAELIRRLLRGQPDLMEHMA
ncbi:2Fe-2S iron-sulfur cluster-binding protein [Panacagrimonas sp.]|uniref:2Fe-2S iron-sulfur cluster-binding protein n=1 Tax=Panacagrimonas sp. TaxID=2480088 RepID=UPI003B52F9FF